MSTGGGGGDDAKAQAMLEQQLADLSVVDGTSLDVLVRLGQAAFPDASQLGDKSLILWPERDRNAAPNGEEPEDLAAKVERSETRFQSLISQIPAVVFYAALGEGENETFVSPQIEELLGFTADEWLGDPLLWYRQLHPDDHDRLIAAFTRGVQTAEPFRAEVRFFARDGKEVWILGEARLIRDESGRLDFFQGVAFDITATRAAQESLTQIERQRVEELMQINEELTIAKIAAEQAATARQTFLATMTHELRTPLNSVIVLSGLLAEANLTPEHTEMVRTMQTSADFLLQLIADVLDFSRLRASSLELDLRHVNLRVWMRRTVEIIAPAIAEKSLSISVSIGDDVPEVVLGDDVRLRQILLNLLTNATKFTPQGQVAVHLSGERLDGDEWEMMCSVDDSGKGVRPELSEVLFDEFRQADAGVNREHGGTGLGLAISKRLSELMGGDIWVETSALGGARFVFTWRCRVPSDIEDAPPVRPEVVMAQASNELRILIAEDNAVNTFVVKRVLESLGYTAQFATDGHEAVAAVESAAFDVVLMDVSMPGMDGLEATRAIRAKGSGVHQPVIVGLTAHAMPGDRSEGIAAGMDDYLTKPIEKAELANTLAEIALRQR